MTEEGKGNTGKASEILRRRGDRTSKLQKVLDRGSPQSQADDAAGEKPVVQGGAATQTPQEGRPAKPIRITVDLNAHQHRYLREYCLNTGTKGTAVLRGLLAELAEDPELRQRLTQRLKR